MNFPTLIHCGVRRTFLALTALTSLLLVGACNKNLVEGPSVGAATDEVVFLTKGSGPSYNVTTKATVVDETSLNASGFNVSATTGAAEAETAVWTSQPFTLGEGVFSGNKWWPSTDPGYHFFASNASLTHTADGNTVAASNDVDVVAAYLPSPTYKAVNTLQFEHVFARLGSVTITAESGYTISNVSVRITPKVSGTYNLKAGFGVTDGSAGWSNVTEAASPSVIASQVGANANDIYLVPGTYNLKVTWTATVGDYSQTFTDMPAEVSLTAGKVSSFTAELGGLAKQVQFRISVTPWDDEPTAQVSVSKRDMLTFTVVTPGKILWKKSGALDGVTLQYSKNGGAWTDITATSAGAEIAVVAGDVLKFKGTGPTGVNASNYCYFNVIDGVTFNTSGSVMSLIGGDDVVLSGYCFYGLFMECLGLLSAPELPATILASSCYQQMFQGCTGLTRAPELPATTLASQCYANMFRNCSGLTSAPELPATSLADYCYYYMFDNCTGLINAPELPATSLAQSCYAFMFNGCTGLSSVICLATDISASYHPCFYNWLTNVSSTGTFKKVAGVSYPSGTSGIPLGWTVEEI